MRNMKASYALCILSLLLLFASSIDGRKDMGEYWRDVMKDQGNIKQKGEKSFVSDFEPPQDVTIYHKDIKLTGEKSFVKDFEPRPDVTIYHNDIKPAEEKSFFKDF
ncbi:organ-specific protein P4-like [Pistacia vera]|uniref:organ-specific protein P4-like n=1 Tax=Pistacia vera TaxID=55513 RepID=UPI001263E341|nr:organ-specific protein P4-like [Pistacia vera]